jgi:hypothetical protein
MNPVCLPGQATKKNWVEEKQYPLWDAAWL